MKKFWSSILSGKALIIFLLVVQVILFIAFPLLLDFLFELWGVSNNVFVALAYLGIKLFEFIFAIILFFKILNIQEDPEFKIIWLVGLILMPLFMIMVYVVFGNHGLNKKDKKIMKLSREANDQFIEVDNKDPNYEKGLGRALPVFKYITNTAHLTGHKNNKVTYYPTGEEFFPAMIEALKEAKEFIFIEFFIITDGKLWTEIKDILIQKAKEGVNVRIVYDDMGCLTTISALTPKELGKYGIWCHKFHPFRPLISGAYNNRDHRKIVIVDHKYGFTGGINLADEYANIIKRFGYWKDTMVRIEGSAINNLIATFLQNYDIASRRISDFSKFLNYEYPKFEEEGYVMPFGDGPGDIDNYLIGEQNYINMLNYAQKKIYISTPYLVPTYPLMDALRNAALRGVEVNLIVPGIPDKKLVYYVAQSNFRFLLDAGVHIYIYTPGFNHMKSALADDELAFVGTINFDFRSLVHHFECGTLLYKNPCIKDIHDDFENMIKESKEVPQDFKMKKGRKTLCSIVKLFEPLL